MNNNQDQEIVLNALRNQGYKTMEDVSMKFDEKYILVRWDVENMKYYAVCPFCNQMNVSQMAETLCEHYANETKQETSLGEQHLMSFHYIPTLEEYLGYHRDEILVFIDAYSGKFVKAEIVAEALGKDTTAEIEHPKSDPYRFKVLDSEYKDTLFWGMPLVIWTEEARTGQPWPAYEHFYTPGGLAQNDQDEYETWIREEDERKLNERLAEVDANGDETDRAYYLRLYGWDMNSDN